MYKKIEKHFSHLFFFVKKRSDKLNQNYEKNLTRMKIINDFSLILINLNQKYEKYLKYLTKNK